MIKNPVKLQLYGNTIQGGGYIREATQQLEKSWRRSVRDVGGFWIGTAEWEGTTAEMLEVFQHGLQWQIQERVNSVVTWQGFLAEMTLTFRGQTYSRDWTQLANRVKTVYSKIGNNLITNPSCEASVWAAIGTPTTREQSTTGATEGIYSAHVVTDAALEGVTIEPNATVEAGREYQARVTVNVISGVWRLTIYTAAAVIDEVDTFETGQQVMYAAIPEDNEVTAVGISLVCVDAAGECYADAAVLQLSPTRAETQWYENALSIGEYGTIESVLLQAGMTDAAAIALARKTLYDQSWASVRPPNTIEVDTEPVKDKLEMTFLGYSFTLRNKYSRQAGTTSTASAIITALLSEAEFVAGQTVDPNALEYRIEDQEAIRAWNVIKAITEAGDAAGNRWTCGMYRGRRFEYRQADTSIVARLRGGVLTDPAGGPLMGWDAEPGLVALDDMPRALDTVASRAAEQGRVAWMPEVEFDLGKYLEGESGITYRRTVA